MDDIKNLKSGVLVDKIRLYLGYAPGKTTAINGLAIRALGAGLKVKIILFSKYSENTSESKIYKLLKKEFPDSFDYFFAGISRIRDDGSFRFFGDKDGWSLEDQLKLNEGISILLKDVSSGEYDVLFLDELTDLIYHKEQRVPEELAKKIFSNIHPKTSIIITGHKCPEWLKDSATTIVEGKVLKHYQGYSKGIEW